MTDVVDTPEGSNRRLNRMVATTVVALSVVMAVGKIKDDNIVQAMQADQASKIDLWSEYQATRIKAHDREIETALLQRIDRTALELASATAENRRYQAEARAIRAKAEAASNDYDTQGRRDDQFDLSDGFLSIAIAVAAIAALVESLGVLGVSWISAGLGLLFLVAGFAELPIHPDALVAFLT
jgi:Flp pilus assembly protein TadB